MICTFLQCLRNNSRVDINLASYDFNGNFDKFWRVRLNMMRVILLDEFDKPIPSPGTDFGGYIEIHVAYPTLFNDTSLNLEKVAFLAQQFPCKSDYYTIGEGWSSFNLAVRGHSKNM